MSQTTEIPFIGVHNTTTENLNENGEVAMSFGLTSNDVAATTTMPAVTHLYHIDGCRILLIHNGSGFKNVFVARPSYDDNGEVKKWTTEAYTYEALNNPDETPAIMCSEPGLPNSTAVLGNVVVLNYDDRCRYAFRKNDTYVIRDNTLPPIVFEAAAYAKIVEKAISDVPYVRFNPDNSSGKTDFKGMLTGLSHDKAEEFKSLIYDQYIALKSSWAQYGYLCSPILIRVAYRLKTGELVGHTNPVVCMPNLTGSVMTAWHGKGDTDVISIVYTPFVKIVECADLNEYGDLIDGIEVFTSVQIERDKIRKEDITVYEYNTDATSYNLFCLSGFYFSYYTQGVNGYSPFSGEKLQLTFCICREVNTATLEAVDNFYFAKRIPFSSIEVMNGCNILEEDKKKENLLDVDGFRRVFMDESFSYIDASNDAISTRARMSDPLRPNARVCYSKVYSVNKRVLANVKSFTYNDINITNSYFSHYCIKSFLPTNNDIPNYVYVFVNQEDVANSNHDHRGLEKLGFTSCSLDGIHCSASDDKRYDTDYQTLHSSTYEFVDSISGETSYINTDKLNVTKFTTCEEPNLKRVFSLEFSFNQPKKIIYKELRFRKHGFLNMSIADGEITERELDVDNNQSDREFYDKIISLGSGVYTQHNDYIRLSNVGDPYSFDASNTAYFNSPVERVMIVPEAITLGQYGTDQIYVICQDGVYTVGLNDEGKLTRVNTFTSDKIDANRACIAGGQLFVNNGISWDFYQGQNRNKFLSMKRNTAFHFDNLPHILSLNETKQWEWCLQGENLFDFMQRCTLYYDSINAQIIGVVPNTGFYLVWSKDDGFRMVKSNAEYRVQYNTLLLADNNSNLYDFEATDTVQQDDGMVIMRPFHLNAEQKNGLSTVRSVIVRGNFDSSTSNCAVKIILYGTMDYKTWHVVASSTRYYITGISGTPYAAFRLVILAKLKRDEYLSHITVEYDNKESKRLHF